MKAIFVCGEASRIASVILCAALLVAPSASAQTAVRIDSGIGKMGWLTNPYRTSSVPNVNLANTARLQSLIRAGNLYLSAADVVALAIENNIDVEVQRYAPLLARQVLKRAQAGGVLRSVGTGVAAGPQSVSLQGVNVSASGLGSGGGVSSGGGILTQLGPGIPSLDPTLSAFANFSHSTSPQSNTFLTGITSFVADTRTDVYKRQPPPHSPPPHPGRPARAPGPAVSESSPSRKSQNLPRATTRSSSAPLAQ